MTRPTPFSLALVLCALPACASGDLMDGDTEAASVRDDETGGSGGPTNVSATTGVTDSNAGPTTATGPSTEPATDAGSTTQGASAEGSTTVDPPDDDGDDDTSSSSSGNEDESSGDESTGAPLPGFVDLSGFTLSQTSSSRMYTFPDDTVVAEGSFIVVGRDATQSAFEQFWGVQLGDDVLYINTGDEFPAINGDEVFSLASADGEVVDGPSEALEAGASLQRVDPSASGAAAWSSVSDGNADPGQGAVPGPGHEGPFISEASDASGSGSFVYEFVEVQVWP